MSPAPLPLDALRERIEACRARAHYPSVAVGILRDGALVATLASGTLTDGSAPTATTRYRIASMTKSFTAAAVLTLRDDGVVRLDAPITDYLPELAHFRAPTQDAPRPCVRDLLTMASGLASDDPWADRHMDIDEAPFAQLLAQQPVFAHTSGTAFEYSNLGYALLGRIAARVSGQRLQTLVETRLLQPLRMDHSGWHRPANDWAQPHRVEDGVARIDDLAPLADGELAPLGGLWSCVTDIVRWMAFLADAFPARDGQDNAPLCRASRREMQQLHRFDAVRERAGRAIAGGYGYGLMVRHDPRFGHIVTHSGGLPGYGSNMRWLVGGSKEQGFGVVALANATYASMAELTFELLEAIDDAGALSPAAPRHTSGDTTVAALAQSLVALLGAWDDEVADRLFADNVALDESYARRRRAAETFVTACGGQLRIRLITAHATSANVALDTAVGVATVDLSLAPLAPHRIQDYVLRNPGEPSDR